MSTPGGLAETVDARLHDVAAALPPEQSREMMQIGRAQAAAAAATLREGRTTEMLRCLAETTADFARNAGEHLLPMFPPDGPVACRTGCSYCCHLFVTASAPEVFRLADYLRETLLAGDYEALLARLADLDERTRGLNWWQRAEMRLACTLLVDGRCSAYPARPLSCWGYTSLDVERCRAAFETGSETAIPACRPQQLAWAGVRTGLETALADAGYDGGDLELNAALRIALETENAAERWLASEDVFAPARPRSLPPMIGVR